MQENIKSEAYACNYGIKTLFLQSIIFARYEILGQNGRNGKIK